MLAALLQGLLLAALAAGTAQVVCIGIKRVVVERRRLADEQSMEREQLRDYLDESIHALWENTCATDPVQLWLAGADARARVEEQERAARVLKPVVPPHTRRVLGLWEPARTWATVAANYMIHERQLLCDHRVRSWGGDNKVHCVDCGRILGWG